MSEDLKHITTLLTSINILPEYLKTKDVAMLLKCSRKQLYKDDLRIKLGGKRNNMRKDFVFKTEKVIEQLTKA